MEIKRLTKLAFSRDCSLNPPRALSASRLIARLQMNDFRDRAKCGTANSSQHIHKGKCPVC
jgi:hypothetical protein